VKLNTLLWICLAVLLLFANCSSTTTPAAAADSITGTWSGQWGPSPSRQTQVTVELKWDGKSLKGTINPGPNAVELIGGSFDAQTGSVNMELDGPNSRGEVVRYKIEGKLSEKTLAGTFDRGGETGTFKIEKQ
jgi:hypothetical protein